jgi:ABC-2 type transport system permease protein
MMTRTLRLLRLWLAFARFSLATELSFRTNFLVKICVEALWLGILLVFYVKLFDNTQQIAGWDRWQYLFFLGCHYTMTGLIDTLFLENCTQLTELVRSGDLDTYLLRPIDEQVLISCRWVDWSTAPNIVLGVVIMIFSLVRQDWQLDVGRLCTFLLLFGCGCGIAYSFLLLLCSTSVWMIRNQSLLEMWWLFTTLMRYPREIYDGRWAKPFGLFFTFIVPVMLVINVPAHVMVKGLSNVPFILFTVAATVALLYLSRRFFRYSLKSYRSASS